MSAPIIYVHKAEEAPKQAKKQKQRQQKIEKLPQVAATNNKQQKQ